MTVIIEEKDIVNHILQTPEDIFDEQAFNRLTKLAQEVFNVSYSLITLPTQKENWLYTFLRKPKGYITTASLNGEHSNSLFIIETGKAKVIHRDELQNQKFNLYMKQFNAEFFAGVPLFSESGSVIGSFSIFHDKSMDFTEEQLGLLKQLAACVVTELELHVKLKQEKLINDKLEQLARKNQWLSHAVDYSTESFLLTDPNLPGNPVVYCNDSFIKQTGYSKSELLGNSIEILKGPETNPKAVEKIQFALKERKSIKITLLNYKKDGTPFWNKVHCSPIFNEQGKLIHFAGLMQDVTKEKQEQLTIVKEFFQQDQLFQAIPDIVCMLNEHGELIQWNNLLNTATDAPDYDLYEEKLFDLLSQVSRQEWERYLEEVKLGNGVQFNSRINYKEHHSVEFMWSLVPILVDEKAFTFAAIGKDITEQLNLKKQVMLARQIQNEQFLTNITHPSVDVEAINFPNQYLSGDLYGYHFDEKMGVLKVFLVDILGHGITTALKASAIRNIFNDAMNSEAPILQKISIVNERCHAMFSDDFFAAAIYLEADLVTKTCYVVPAGISKVLFIDHEDKKIEKKLPGRPLGIFEDTEYDCHKFKIENNSQIHIGTDGAFDQLSSEHSFKELTFKNVKEELGKLALKGSKQDDASVVSVHFKYF